MVPKSSGTWETRGVFSPLPFATLGMLASKKSDCRPPAKKIQLAKNSEALGVPSPFFPGILPFAQLPETKEKKGKKETRKRNKNGPGSWKERWLKRMGNQPLDKPKGCSFPQKENPRAHLRGPAFCCSFWRPSSVSAASVREEFFFFFLLLFFLFFEAKGGC